MSIIFLADSQKIPLIPEKAVFPKLVNIVPEMNQIQSKSEFYLTLLNTYRSFCIITLLWGKHTWPAKDYRPCTMKDDRPSSSLKMTNYWLLKLKFLLNSVVGLDRSPALACYACTGWDTCPASLTLIVWYNTTWSLNCHLQRRTLQSADWSS